MKRFIWFFFLVLLLGYSPIGKAELYDRGGGLIYDDVLDVTWLQDANLPLSLGYSLDGRMYWDEAKTWVENLAYYDEVRDIVWTNWRLPNILPQNGSEYDFNFAHDGSTDKGANITSIQSELAYMYYVNLGNIGSTDVNGNPQTGFGLVNTEPFIGLVEYSYWSGQEHYPDTYIPLGLDPDVWAFAMQQGLQDAAGLSWRCYIWPVMEGDVGVIPIPEPSIAVTSPNGGEDLNTGEDYEITWTFEGDIDSVKIEYSVDNGNGWTEIIASTDSDGSFGWEVPCDISTDSLIRISDLNSNASDTSDGVFSIIDDIAPNIDVSATPDVLWPPNHKMVHVTTTVTATDNCDTEPAIELVSVIMNESDETITYDPNYDSSVNDGKTSGDIQIIDDFNFYLRCERSGKSDGRTYTITYKAIDDSGNESTAYAEVLVPHSM